MHELKILPYPDFLSAVHGLLAQWNSLPAVDLNLLPYNRFDAVKSSVWWLAPTREKVAFKYGKLLVGEDHPVSMPGSMFCGLHIEKGPEYVGVKAGHKLGDDWIWSGFLNDCSGAFNDAASEARRVLNADLDIHVFAWPDGGGGPDHLQFELGDAGLKNTEAVTPLNVLEGLDKADSVPALGRALSDLSSDRREFYWIGVQVGHMFKLDPAGPDDTDQCLRMLRVFEPWLRAGS